MTSGTALPVPHARAASERSGPCGAPLVSVITPSYNQGAYIERCIQSVLAQAGVPFEHIVVDNCSSDATVDILRRYPHVRWISEPDHGQSHALNKALALARGEIIAWINADDAYLPGAFQAASAALSAPGGPHAAAGGVEHVDADGRALGVFRPQAFSVERMSEFWSGYGLEQPGVFFRRELVDRVGSFDESLHYVMDYDFFLRVRAVSDIRVLTPVVARFVEHPESKTGRERYGSAFVRELVRVASRYWGPQGDPARARRARACRLHVADHFASAVWRASRSEGRVDWRAAGQMIAWRPLLALHPRLWRVILASAWRVPGSR